MIGAMAGAMPKIIDTWRISRCASGPLNRSRIIARPTIIPTPADRPCSARNASNLGKSCDSAHPIEPAMNNASPPRIIRSAPHIGERPMRDAHQAVGQQIDADCLLDRHLVHRRAAAELRERREDGVDRKRAEHRQPGKQQRHAMGGGSSRRHAQRHPEGCQRAGTDSGAGQRPLRRARAAEVDTSRQWPPGAPAMWIGCAACRTPAAVAPAAFQCIIVPTSRARARAGSDEARSAKRHTDQSAAAAECSCRRCHAAMG